MRLVKEDLAISAEAIQELHQMGPAEDWPDETVSDAFFNSEQIIRIENCYNGKAVRAAAKEFVERLPHWAREKYTVFWLVNDYYRRL